MKPSVHLRLAHPTDRAAIAEIALRTGDAGEDASARFSSRTLIGDIFALPYPELCPQYAFVIQDAIGVCGYIVGVPDTLAFERLLEEKWWPMVRARYPLPLPDDPRCALERYFIENFIHKSRISVPDYLRDYPAHFHINLLVERARGQGARMLKTLFDAFRSGGISGVHCGVDPRNERAKAFYVKHGGLLLQTGEPGTVYGFGL